MNMRNVLFPAVLAFVLFSCSTNKEQAIVSRYPITDKVDTVDNYFGVAVSDPYRWLENDTTKATAA